MNRRKILALMAAAPIAGAFAFGKNFGFQLEEIDGAASDSEFILSNILSKADEEKWSDMAFGEMFAKAGLEFIGVPYAAGTLESEGDEVCRVNLAALDCVTFFENALGIARIIKKGLGSMTDLFNEVRFTRYRGGIIDDYTTRLHYTADWIYDNSRKGVVKDISKEIGGVPLKLSVSYMSSNPSQYPALKREPALIKKMAEIEKVINSRDYFFIPKNAIQASESKIESGDIVAFSTNIKGLDYSHIGIAVRSRGITRLLHASTKAKKVILDERISDYIAKNEKMTGITVARPVVPNIMD